MIASPSARSSSSSASLQPPLQIGSPSSSISRTGLTLRRPNSVAHLFFRQQHASLSPNSPFSSKPLNLVMQWQDCKVKLEVDVPTSVAYECYSDREASLSFLLLSVFGQELEFSLIARNLQPIPNQKIHWRSMEGLPNRGAVRLYPKGSSSCLVELTVSYEVPAIIAPVASALIPFTEGIFLEAWKGFQDLQKSINLAPLLLPTDSTS